MSAPLSAIASGESEKESEGSDPSPDEGLRMNQDILRIAGRVSDVSPCRAHSQTHGCKMVKSTMAMEREMCHVELLQSRVVDSTCPELFAITFRRSLVPFRFPQQGTDCKSHGKTRQVQICDMSKAF